MKRGSCVLSKWGTLPLTILLPASLTLILYFLVQPGKGEGDSSSPCQFAFQFSCNNGNCTPSRFRCNERDDCGDGSDEKDCFPTNKLCASDQFRCGSGKCIPEQYHCDKKPDCLDGSDEKECSCSRSNSMFNCTNDPYRCILNVYRCDGYNDCTDGSDENNCVPCSQNAFTCDDNKGPCILRSGYCDGVKDCPNNEDEKSCPNSNPNNNCSELRCSSGHCIPRSKKCDRDKKRDCEDWSDEASCDSCTPTQFACTVGRACLPRSKLCNGFPDCADKSDEINCEDGAPNNWLGKSRQDQNESLTRQFADGNVVVYYDTQFKPGHITWFHDDLSKAWQYVKEMYGLFGEDPRLYFILRYANYHHPMFGGGKDSVCESTLYIDGPKYNGRNVILCHTYSAEDAWKTPDTFSKFQLLFSNIGDLIVKELQKEHTTLFSQPNEREYLSDLIFYDIFINMRGNTNEIKEWTFSQNGTTEWINLFHDYIFPAFYEDHGLAPVLSNLNILLKIYRPNFSIPRQPTSTQPFAFVHLFMHFLSGAAGQDLLSQYSFEFNQSFSSTDEFDKTFNELTNGLPNAASKFSTITYKMSKDSNDNNVPPRNWHKRWRGQDEHLTFAYSNSSARVAFYFKNFQLYYHKDAFQKISQVWKFITDNENYGLNSTKPFLSVVLSDVNITDGGWGCLSSNDLKIDDKDFDSRQVIECGLSAHSKWANPTEKYLDDIVVHMARLILKLNGGVGNWPARTVSAWTMESILVYDIYKSLGKTLGVDHENTWNEAQRKKTENFPMAVTPWYRYWYHNIYDRDNGSKAIRNFLSLVQNYWPKKEEDKEEGGNHLEQMNTGEFIHFWSAAVNRSLLLTYQAEIWRNSGSVIVSEICKAIQAYPQVSYPDRETDCKTSQNPTTPIWIIYAMGGGAAGVLLLILLGFGIKFGMYRKRLLKMSNYIRNLTKEEMSEFYQGNPNLSKKDAHAAIDQLPFNDMYEVPRERLIIEDCKLLGAGEFGVVKQGILKGAPDSGMPDVDVAVKMVKKNVEVLYFKAMLTEIKIMAHMGKHDHIASLLATVTKNIINCEVYVAIEFCARGDLHGYLMSNADKFKDLFSTESGETSSNYSNFKAPESKKPLKISNKTSANFKKAVSISTLDLLEWTRQMAVGMHFLDTKNVIHGDLAARNVLITDNNVAKISDFGLSRQLVNYSNYLKKSQTPLPWRWLAIESLTSMSFSVHSDIWAYGVTMWEIFSLGKVPYPGRTWDHEFVDELTAGVRLPKPEFGNHEVYTVMLDCMRKVPDERIGFPQIASKLERIIKSLGGICAIPSTSTSTSTPGPSSSNFQDLPLPPPPADWNNPLPTPPKPTNTLPTPPKPSSAVPTPPKPTNTLPTLPKLFNPLPTPPKPSNSNEIPTPPKPTNTLPTPPKTSNAVPTPPKPTTNPLPTAPKNINIGAAMLKPANPLPTFPKPANPLPTLPKAANPLPTFPKPAFNNTPALPPPQLPPSSSPAKPALPSRKW